MRKFSTVAVTLAALLFPVAPALADPGSPGCVTRAEYGKVRKGMTKGRVDRVFGTRGKRDAGATSGGYRSEVWSYRACTQFSAVAVSYSAVPGGALRLAAKNAVWSY